MKHSLQYIISILCFLACGVAMGAETKKSDRQKILAFDDPSLVEGVNKQPYDSLSQLGKNRKNKKTRLYQKRTHFPVENLELISELAVSP